MTHVPGCGSSYVNIATPFTYGLHWGDAMFRAALCCLLSLAVAGMAMEDKELREGNAADGALIITYCLRLPEPLVDGRRYPLIICFHGHGGRAQHHAEHVLKVLKQLGLRDEVIVLGAKSQNEGWELPDHVPVTKLLQWALNTHPVDPRRVYTHGMSSGGSMSGLYALTHPELIAAGVVYGAGIGFGTMATPPDPAATHPDLYLVMGQKDDDPHKNHGQATTRWLTERKFRHIYRYPEDLAHTPEHPLTNRDSMQWLLRQRHKTIAPPNGDLESLRALAKSDAVIDDAAIATLARIGGPPAAAVVGKQLARRDSGVHTALLQVGLETCLGDEVHVQIGKRLLKSADADVRNATISLYAQDVRWRYAVASQALQQISADRKRDLAEREAAATGLAEAAAFQVRGNYQDPELIIAVVKLLDADEESLRRIAHNALKPGHETTYDPAADKGSRAAGLRSFQQWALDLKPLHAH